MSQDFDDNDEGGSVDPAVEAKAREMGWQPQERFKGDKSKWVDAQTYVERGEHVLPIVRAERDRLRNDLLTRDGEIDRLRKQLETTNAIVKDLGENFETVLSERLADQKRSLRAQLKEAVEDRDTDAELNIREQLDNLTEAEKAAKEKRAANKEKLKTATQDSDPQPEISPDFKAWHKDNKWFGEDKKRTKEIQRIAEDLRDEGEESTGREFMDKCLEILEEREAERSNGGKRPISKTEGGSPRVVS